MASTQVVGDLRDVQFYTALDPYYYVVDNRPLEDLDFNQKLVAEAVDAQAGSSDRDALAVAAVSYATTGYSSDGAGQGQFAGTYTNSLLDLQFNFGFATRINPDITTRDKPQMGVFNGEFAQTISRGASAGSARQNHITMSFRDSRPGDEFYSATSTIKVIELQYQEGTSDSTYNSSDPFGTTNPPSYNPEFIPIVKMVVPNTTTDLGTVIDTNHWQESAFTDIAVTSNPLSNIALTYVEQEGVMPINTSTIQITNTNIDYAGNQEAIELFLEGANQFNFEVNPLSGLVTLTDGAGTPAPVSAAANYRVRQIQAYSK